MKVLPLNTDFNFDEYQPVEGEKITYKGDEKLKQAVVQHQQFASEIRNNMVMLLYNQIFQELDGRKELNQLLEKNKLVWAKLLMRSKNFQELIAEMVERAKMLIDKEFKYNDKQIDIFLKFPRPIDNRLKLIPPAPREKLPHEMNPRFNESPLARRLEQKKQEESMASLQRASIRRTLAAPPLKRVTVSIPKQREPPEELVQMKKRLKEIDALMETLEETNETLGYNLDQFDDKSNKRNQWRIEKFKTVGLQLEQKLEQIVAYHPPSHDDINYYVQEGWKEYEIFEKELAAQKEEHQIEMRQMKHGFLRQMDWIKRKTAFRIKALEIALTEVKLQKRTMIERQNMEQAERESQEFNDQFRLQEIDEHVKGNHDIADVNNIEVARKRLTRLDKMVKTLNKRLKATTTELNQANRKIKHLEEQARIREEQLQKLTSVNGRHKENLKAIISSTQLYKNAARHDQLIAMLSEQEQQGEEMVLNYFRDNPVEDLIGPIRRDNKVLRQKLGDVVARLKRERVISRSNLKKKDVERSLTFSGELRIFLQNELSNYRLKQILALKEGQDAVGLVDEPIEVKEEQDSEEEDILSSNVSLRPASKNKRFQRMKSRVSDNEEHSSQLKSPSQVRDAHSFDTTDRSAVSTKQQTGQRTMRGKRPQTIVNSKLKSTSKKRPPQKTLSKDPAKLEEEPAKLESENLNWGNSQIVQNLTPDHSFDRYVEEEKNMTIKSTSKRVLISAQTLKSNPTQIEISLKGPQIQPDSDDQIVPHDRSHLPERMTPPVFVSTPLDFYRKLKLGALKHMHLDRKDIQDLRSKNFRVALQALNSIILEYQPTSQGRVIAAQYLTMSEEGTVIVDKDRAQQLSRLDEAHLFTIIGTLFYLNGFLDHGEIDQIVKAQDSLEKLRQSSMNALPAQSPKGKEQKKQKRKEIVTQKSQSLTELETLLREAWMLGLTLRSNKKRSTKATIEELLEKTTVLPQKRGLQKMERKLSSLIVPYVSFIVEAIKKRDYDRTAKILDIRTQLEILTQGPLLKSPVRRKVRPSQSPVGIKISPQAPERKIGSETKVIESKIFSSKRVSQQITVYSNKGQGIQKSDSEESLKLKVDMSVVNMSQDSKLEPILSAKSLLPSPVISIVPQRAVQPYQSKVKQYHSNMNEFVKRLKDKQRKVKEMVEQRQRELEREEDEKIDIEKILKHPGMLQTPEIEGWIQSQTKKTISALEKYIRITQGLEDQSTDDDGGRGDDETTRPTRSYILSTMQPQHNSSIFSGRIDEPETDTSIAISTTPTSKYFANKSMRGHALKSFPKNRFKYQRGTFTFNSGRGGSLGREENKFDPKYPYHDLTPIASAGGKNSLTKSPHLELLEKQISQDQLFQPQLLEDSIKPTKEEMKALEKVEQKLSSSFITQGINHTEPQKRYEESERKDPENSHIPQKLLAKREAPHLPLIKNGGSVHLPKQSKMDRALLKSRNAYLGISSKSNQTKLRQIRDQMRTMD